MILKELYKLYGRLASAGEEVPQKGRKLLKISFRIILNKEGNLLRLESTLGDDKKIPELMALGDENRTSGIKPFFLCDTAKYLLGYADTDEAGGSDSLEPSFTASKEKHLKFERDIDVPAYSAICRFLKQWNPDTVENKELLVNSAKEGLFKSNGVFQIEGEREYVHELELIQRWWDKEGKDKWQDKCQKGGLPGEKSDKKEGMCLVTGKIKPIAVLHQPAIKNVIGAQSSGAMLVSFNQESFCSYGETTKTKGFNAPVSEEVAFGYCNALNYLTGSTNNRIRLGEDTIVFWSDAPRCEAIEAEQFALLGLDIRDESEQGAQDSVLTAKLKQSLQELAQGKKVSNLFATPPDTRFFILGISPNAARLSIRFWQESTFGDFVEKLRMHYDALSLAPDFNKTENESIITPFRILRSSVREAKDINPYTGGALMRAILCGIPYPDTLAIAIIHRFGAGDPVNHVRCSYLKAWLSRKKSPIQIQYMLNKEETNPAYLLGRLFAVLEKTQQDALPGLNRTVRESYYASASATPAMVFPRLLRLYNHHLAKLETGRAIVRDRLVQEISDTIGIVFPKRLDLNGQGIFALGYYQQKQDFYTKKDTETENSEEE